jgi:hypothetical protein
MAISRVVAMSRMIENLVNAAVQVLKIDVFRDPREYVGARIKLPSLPCSPSEVHPDHVKRWGAASGFNSTVRAILVFPEI